MAILQMKKTVHTGAKQPASFAQLVYSGTALVAMETFPQGREPWTKNIAFQTE